MCAHWYRAFAPPRERVIDRVGGEGFVVLSPGSICRCCCRWRIRLMVEAPDADRRPCAATFVSVGVAVAADRGVTRRRC